MFTSLSAISVSNDFPFNLLYMLSLIINLNTSNLIKSKSCRFPAKAIQLLLSLYHLPGIYPSVNVFETVRGAGGQNSSHYPFSSLPPNPPPHLFLFALYFLKVSVWEINDRSASQDDSLHKDDIELISEMLQNWLFDVYGETWIIKILLKTPWMADTRILFVMINLTWPLQWESTWIVLDKMAFHSLLRSPRYFSLDNSVKQRFFSFLQ